MKKSFAMLKEPKVILLIIHWNGVKPNLFLVERAQKNWNQNDVAW